MSELHIILGPMFSGKTTRLIELSKKYSNPLVINHALDVRYHATDLSTHDGIHTPCIQAFCLDDISKLVLSAADAIFVNEAQFFPDLLQVIEYWLSTYNKPIYVCGLDGDFRQQPFGDLLKIIPLCDTVEKLCAKCNCGNPAIFTQRLSPDQNQTLIGTNIYKPSCRLCFIQEVEIMSF